MSALTMTTTTNPANAPAKKPYARPMTEKRKEQNRRSQKVYREKLKKKLEELKEQVQAKTQRESSSPTEVTLPDVAEHVSSSPAPSTTSKNRSNVIDINAAFAAAGDLALPTDTALPIFELGIRGRFSQSARSSTAPTPSDQDAADETPIPKFLAADVYAPVDPGSVDMRLMWLLPVDTYTQSYTPPTTRERQISQNKTWTSARTTPSLSWSPLSRTPSKNTTPSGVPSLYLNHLRLLGETAFQATLDIAASLGITRSAYINDHPSPLGPYNDRVPSYNYKAIPKDLRPTPEQMTLCHPGYLDCIVFPKFRSNAIVLSSRGELDHCSLFLDLMHDGLVCWGNQNAGQSAGRDMRDGIAWSKRSWEARPWFLRRWGWLLAIDPSVVGIGLAKGDGLVIDEDEHDTDGIFEGSRWWRSMRGEIIEEEEQTHDGTGGPVEEHGEMLSRLVVCNIGARDVHDFAQNGVLWPTQFEDRMSMKLQSVGLSAPSTMELEF